MAHTFNKGEWSEVYIFLRSLLEERIAFADDDLQRLDSEFFVVRRAFRENLSYEISPTAHAIEVVDLSTGKRLTTYPYDLAEEHIQELFASIREYRGTFSVPSAIEDFLEEICITQVKAKSSSKGDVTFQVHDPHTNLEPILDFSVKSFLGGNPTLLNAASSTRFEFSLSQHLDNDTVAEINSIQGRDKIQQRIDALHHYGVQLSFLRAPDPVFSRNLSMLDFRMPEILGTIFLISYGVKGKRLPDVVEKYCDLYNEDKDLITYKVKEFLLACALGLRPQSPWSGYDEALGGYIVLTHDGDIVCFPMHSRNTLKDYLYRHTAFDTPSTKRTGAGLITEQGEQQVFTLTAQIRFKD